MTAREPGSSRDSQQGTDEQGDARVASPTVSGSTVIGDA
jgi:hypothetical protein